MKKFNLKPGDKVIVRQWDDMQREFGLDYGGHIKCSGIFATGMKRHCGKIFTVKSHSDYGTLNFKERVGWMWTDDMIYPLPAPQVKAEV